MDGRRGAQSGSPPPWAVRGSATERREPRGRWPLACEPHPAGQGLTRGWGSPSATLWAGGLQHVWGLIFRRFDLSKSKLELCAVKSSQNRVLALWELWKEPHYSKNVICTAV